MTKTSKLLVVCLLVLITCLCLSGCKSKKKEKIIDVNIEDRVSTMEDVFSSETYDAKPEAAEVKHSENVVAEKIAVFPEYDFKPENKTYYILKDTYLKNKPYDDGRKVKKMTMYSEVTVTGKNDLKYWEVEIDGIKYYIDSSFITKDSKYVFNPVNYNKYTNRETVLYETPYINDRVIDYPKVNSEVLVIGENDTKFVKVVTDYGEGYILKDSLMDEKINVDIKEDGIYTVHNEEELELIWAIVQQECGSSYEGALAVISSAANRCNSARWAYEGDTIYKQLTAPGQYCYSIDTYWQRWLGGNVNDCVKQAVSDGLNGKTNHNFTCFRSTNGGDPSRVNIGGNWYFGD